LLTFVNIINEYNIIIIRETTLKGGKNIMKKIIGIFIMTLFIGTTALPLLNSVDKNDIIWLSNEEYYNDYLCGSNSGSVIELIKTSSKYNSPPDLKITSVPDYFNWKDFGGQDWTTPAKDQAYPKYCGSCFIFSPIGTFESIINIMEGSAVIDPDLSEQYVLSCLPIAGSCIGGRSSEVMYLIMAEHAGGNNHNGVPLEECFPYQADDTIPCDDKCSDWLDKLVPMLGTNWWSRDDQDIMLFKRQIMEKGPGSGDMMFTAEFEEWEKTHHDPDDYYPYKPASEINHCIIIVGWKDDPSIDNGGYWIIKDSHGTEVGYDGFFNIEYNSLNINEWLAWIEYDPESYEWPNEPDPPSTTTITGETNGKKGDEYEYTFSAADPEDYELKYYISWGDGDWEWTDYYPSGEDVTMKHTYNSEGNYSIASLAMNTNDNIGPWGTLYISIPKNKSINIFNPWLLRLIQRFPSLKLLL
jgi:hypothetical protein